MIFGIESQKIALKPFTKKKKKKKKGFPHNNLSKTNYLTAASTWGNLKG